MSDRRSARVKTVSKALKRVDDDTRRQVAAARLDALENDNADKEDVEGEDSDEYVLEDIEGAGPAPKKTKGAPGRPGKRKTRGAQAVQAKKGPRGFAGLLDEARLERERVPKEIPTYLSAAAAPSVLAAPRKFCSTLARGFESCYNCARCGMRFCSRKCNAVHTETRCLKFTV